MRDGNLRRVVVGHGISRFGGAAGFFIGLWGKAAFELEATPGELALLIAATSVAAMLGSVVAGVLIDRWDPRRVLILGEVLFVPAVLTLVWADDLRTLTMLAPLVWLTLSLPHTAMSSFPPVLSRDPAAIERANVGIEAGGTLAFILGPAGGALLATWVSIDAVFVLDAATSLVAVALIAPVRLARGPEREERSALSELVEGFAYSFRRPALRTVLLLGTATWLSFGAFSALEPLFFRDVLGTEVAALGWINTVFGVGLATGTYLLHRLAGRLTTLGWLALLTAAGGLGAIAYTSTTSLVFVALGAVYWGVVLGLVMPLLRTLAHLHTQEGMVGRVMGVLMFQHSLGELLPLAIAPWLAATIGVQWTLIATGAVLIMAGLTGLPHARRLDREEPPVGVVPDRPVGPAPLPELPDPVPPLA